MKSEFVQISRRGRVTETEFYPVIHRMFEEIWQGLLPTQILTEGLSNRVANNVITHPDTPIPECVTCGACCQALLCVSIRPTDSVDPELSWEITSGEGENEIVVDKYVRRNEETLACIALAGTIGEKVGCTIYETRPIMCHHFDAGSDRCHAIRRAFGIEPFLTMNEMSEAIGKLNDQATRTGPRLLIRTAQIKREPASRRFIVSALMNDNSFIEIYRYDPEEETWMQSDFEGLTIEGAIAMIKSRQSS